MYSTANETSYRIIIERKQNTKLSNSITCILLVNNRPCPLADGASITIHCDHSQFEIPVLISKSAKKQFEGILTGTAEGNDIRILLEMDPTQKTLCIIKEAANSTIALVEKPGATKW